MNRSRSKGISLSLVYTILNTVIGIFISSYVIRIIGQSEYGVYQTVSSFAQYLVLFEFGVGTVMTRNISMIRKGENSSIEIQKNVSTLWTITFILSVLISVVSIIFYFNISNIYSKTMTSPQISHGKFLFIFITIRLIFSFFVQTLNGLLIGYEQYTFSVKISLSVLIIRTLAVVILVRFFPDATVIVLADTLLAVISFAATILFCIRNYKLKFTFRYFDLYIFKAAIPLSLALLLQSLVNMANGNVDKFLIGMLLSPEAVAIYSIGMFIYSAFSSLTTVPISMYMPQVAKDMGEGKKGLALTNSLIEPCRVVVLLGGTILFGFIAIGKPFIYVLYGEEYLDTWIIALAVMIPMYLNMSNGILINVLNVLNKRQVRSFFLGVTTVLNIGLTIWWIKTWGIIGAAVATGISTFLGQIFTMNIYYSKFVGIKIMHLYYESFKGLLPAMAVSCILGVLIDKILANNVASFLLGGAAFLLVLLICLFVFGFSPSEKDVARNLFQRLIHKQEKKD